MRRNVTLSGNGDREENILEAIHDASGSTIRANSRRYSTLGPGPARDEAKRDIEADIERYVKVDIEHQAACGTTPRVPTCRCSCAAAAGCATPTRPRGWRRTGQSISPPTISSEHWLRVGAGYVWLVNGVARRV